MMQHFISKHLDNVQLTCVGFFHFLVLEVLENHLFLIIVVNLLMLA